MTDSAELAVRLYIMNNHFKYFWLVSSLGIPISIFTFGTLLAICIFETGIRSPRFIEIWRICGIILPANRIGVMVSFLLFLTTLIGTIYSFKFFRLRPSYYLGLLFSYIISSGICLIYGLWFILTNQSIF